MDRRKFVKLAGITSVTATGALAGCQSGNDDGTEDGNGSGNGEMARYNSWVIPESVANDELLVVSLDMQALAQTEDSNGSQDSTLQNDPLAMLPVSFLFVGAFSTLALGNTGLGSLGQEDAPTETLHIVGGALVLEGSYDAASLGSDAESAGLSESEEYNGYTIYTGNSNAVAISGSAVVVANQSGDGITDPVARVKAHVDADAGNATLFSDQEDKFADLVSALPDRSVMGVAYTTESAPLNQTDGSGSGDATSSFANTNLDGNANGLALSANVESNSMTASVAIRYASSGEVNDESTIESALGAAADEQTVTINGPLVIVEGEYSAVPSLQQGN